MMRKIETKMLGGQSKTTGNSTYPKGWIYLRAASRSSSEDQPRLMVNHPPRRISNRVL
jgi:hypothetical protein